MGIKKGGFCLLGLLLISVVLLIPVTTNAAASSMNFSIMQIDSGLPDLTLFVRFDNVDMNMAKLKENLSVKINDTPAQITDIQPVRNESGVTQNTAFLFLVDTSVSMGNGNRANQLQTLLENLLESVGSNDKAAVFGVSNKSETIKDFNVSDVPQSVVNNIRNAISSGAGTGTYLYSGIRDAVNKCREKTENIPERRVIVLITDGGLEGDSFSSDDIKKYVDVDRLPVYTLILNNESSVDQYFKTAADQIAQKTGGQSFISTNGNNLFTQFRASIDKCSVIKLRCDNFKTDIPQATVIVGLKEDQGEIRQAAKFTATQAAALPATGKGQEKAQGKEQPGQVVVFRSPRILIPVILFVVIISFVLMQFRKIKKVKQRRIRGGGIIPEMIVQNPQGYSGKIGLEYLQGENKGNVIEIHPDQSPRIGSTPECAVRVGVSNKVFGYISVIDDMLIIHTQSPGDVFVNGNAIQGSHILQNDDLVRVPEMIFRIIM